MSALGHKQTCAAHKPISAKCPKRTLRRLFDHVINSRKQLRRQVDPKHSGGLRIDDQLKLGCLYHRQICVTEACSNSRQRLVCGSRHSLHGIARGTARPDAGIR